MAEVDLDKVPFAAWLERVIPQLCRQDAAAIGIVALNKDGTAGTAYYCAEASDKGKMAWWMLADSMLDVVLARGDVVQEALEQEQEREESDDGTEEEG